MYVISDKELIFHVCDIRIIRSTFIRLPACSCNYSCCWPHRYIWL